MTKVLSTTEYKAVEQRHSGILEMTLVKTQKYVLTPFGRFLIKWNPSKAVSERRNILNFSQVRFNDATGMPYTPEQEKAFVKFMIKHKTDVLTDGKNFYTRMGDNWLEIHNSKLNDYKTFLFKKELQDNQESWEAYMETYGLS
jgi:hypothetical protein